MVIRGVSGTPVTASTNERRFCSTASRASDAVYPRFNSPGASSAQYARLTPPRRVLKPCQSQSILVLPLLLPFRHLQQFNPICRYARRRRFHRKLFFRHTFQSHAAKFGGNPGGRSATIPHQSRSIEQGVNRFEISIGLGFWGGNRLLLHTSIVLGGKFAQKSEWACLPAGPLERRLKEGGPEGVKRRSPLQDSQRSRVPFLEGPNSRKPLLITK